MVPNKFERPRRIGERSIMRESSITLIFISGENPGAVKETMYGIKKKITMETKTIADKKTVNTSSINFFASSVTFSPDILFAIKGISTVIEASDAIDMNIRSGILKAA